MVIYVFDVFGYVLFLGELVLVSLGGRGFGRLFSMVEKVGLLCRFFIFWRRIRRKIRFFGFCSGFRVEYI